MNEKIIQEDQTKAIVLLSGGLDSATCLAKAVKEIGTENTIALNAYYGQKHSKEIESARKLAEYYQVKYHKLNLEDIFKYSDCSLLKSSNKEIIHKSYTEQLKEGGGYVQTYVPFRNGLLISTAVTYAMSIGFNTVVLGVHSDDWAGNAYPDCSVEFINFMNWAVQEGTNGEVKILAPFVGYTKKDIVRLGLELEVPYELTWSCYEGGDVPCGECGTCLDRIKAFELNGVVDPLMEDQSNSNKEQ